MARPVMTLLVASALALALQPASAQIRLAGITEARGPGATAGQSLKSGYLWRLTRSMRAVECSARSSS
jgi:hypothetical protein